MRKLSFLEIHSQYSFYMVNIAYPKFLLPKPLKQNVTDAKEKGLLDCALSK